MKSFFELMIALFKQSFRNRAAFFMNIIFPAIFLIMFGLVFKDNNVEKYKYAYYSQSNIPLNVQGEKYDDKNLLTKNISKYDIVAFIEDSSITFYINYRDFNTESWINSVKLDVERYLNNQKQIIRIVDIKKTLPTMPSQLAFIFTGTLAISILSSGMFSSITIFSDYKRHGLFKRLKVLPLSPLKFVLDFSFSQFFISFISVISIRLIALLMFSDLNIKINVIYFLIAVFSTTFGMISLGIVLTLLFGKASSLVGQFLYTVFFFFSGIYFPISFLPDFLEKLSYFMPVKYVVEMIRFSAGLGSLSSKMFLIYALFFTGIGLFFVTWAGYFVFHEE
ncbi:ABC transporter permease [Thermosipho ferrireducens]|uniref:ABC transporter permease n=1 Tax=Thermosipho ferrireducens TaxID=2571116 RepID=A0ABX7S4I3_9BACT|nr:ABC transporter permease [Thermosipho ferrireducens]QTA37354.1 ABC transporter permease [Thermosipho ferrireducens]